MGKWHGTTGDNDEPPKTWGNHMAPLLLTKFNWDIDIDIDIDK